MADDRTFYKGAILVALVWSVGFGCGYEFHKWRIQWLKRRRERLAAKLQDTQREIELLTKH